MSQNTLFLDADDPIEIPEVVQQLETRRLDQRRGRLYLDDAPVHEDRLATLADAGADVFVLSAAEGLFLLILLVSLGLCFVALYGLWTLESWGWTLYLVLQGTVALGEVIRFDILPLAITVLLMWYVYSKRDLYRAHQ